MTWFRIEKAATVTCPQKIQCKQNGQDKRDRRNASNLNVCHKNMFLVVFFSNFLQFDMCTIVPSSPNGRVNVWKSSSIFAKLKTWKQKRQKNMTAKCRHFLFRNRCSLQFISLSCARRRAKTKTDQNAIRHSVQNVYEVLRQKDISQRRYDMSKSMTAHEHVIKWKYENVKCHPHFAADIHF